MARSVSLLGFAAALLAAYGCSSGEGGGLTAPALVCSDGGPAGANAVTMTCGGATDGATEQVDVVLGGPTSGSTTLRGINFDVAYDATKLEFVPSASYASALFPNALIAVELANGQPGRAVVSIQQPGGMADVAVSAGQHIALSLSYRRVAGTTYGPTPLALENAEATSASATISFASGLALSYP